MTMTPPRTRRLLALTLSMAVAAPAAAKGEAGGGHAVPGPLDRAFAGTMTLDVDATDTAHAVFSIHETIPVQVSGDVVLLYPEWETASHAPTIPAAALAGLVTRIDGRRVEWRRDPVAMHAFHLAVPAGAKRIALDFQYLADRGSLDAAMANVQWQRLLLYPAGWFARDIPVSASLRLPAGMTGFTSLDRIAATAPGMRFATLPLDRLVDAPVLAAPEARAIALTPGDPQPVRLDLLAADRADLAISDEEQRRLRDLVAQTRKVFGSGPFAHYDIIVALGDTQGSGGVEHLEEGENFLPARYFLDVGAQLGNRDLIAHEFVHAWNGRNRQPADLSTPAFNEPAGGSLLWVYEGQTEFWGRVLAARAGLRSLPETFDKLALDAAFVANRPGRAWKSLADSSNDAIYMAGRRAAWRDWARREDYYSEGVLLWLDVDARLRELTGGRRGIDDFAARFFRADRPGDHAATYGFEDVVRALDEIAPFDWRRFLLAHLKTHDDADALAGLGRAGWRLVYTAEPSATFAQAEVEDGGLDLGYSIGAVVDDAGRVESVAWHGAAFEAGLAPGDRIVAVGGGTFSRDALRGAVGRSAQIPIRLAVAAGGGARDVVLGYRGGLRYPHLVRDASRPDRLTPLLAPR